MGKTGSQSIELNLVAAYKAGVLLNTTELPGAETSTNEMQVQQW